MTEGPYCRVYHEIVEDPKFEHVYNDNDHLATWLRLLIGADAAYPSPAVLPRAASMESVEALVDAGLVLRIGSDHYRITGMEAERLRRSQRGIAGGMERVAKAERDDAGRLAPASHQRTRPASVQRSSPANAGQPASTSSVDPASLSSVSPASQAEQSKAKDTKAEQEQGATLDKGFHLPPKKRLTVVGESTAGEPYDEVVADAIQDKLGVTDVVPDFGAAMAKAGFKPGDFR
jgi:hypothetical protein